MSVRVALVERAARGSLLRGVRLADRTGEVRWDAPGVMASSPAQQPEACGLAARWLREKLEGPRTRDTLELLCLDDEGSTCAWLDAAPVAKAVEDLARAGPMQDDPGAPRSASALEYYAPSPLDSTVQALLDDDAEPDGPAVRTGVLGRDRRSKGSPAPGSGTQHSRRVAVLAGVDAPVRVLIDALDREGVRLASVGTLWHAMAAAYAPSSDASMQGEGVGADLDALSQDAPPHAVVLVTPAGRLSWCWARGESLVAGGAMRLPLMRTDEAMRVAVGRDDVARLTSEWLAWALQLGIRPSKIVCVLPESLESTDAGALSPAQFCEQVTTGWGGASLDAVVTDDPLGATLSRLAGRLESSPRADHPARTASLVALTTRPGRVHRRMHLWGAGALALLGVGLGIAGFRLHQNAAKAREAALGWINGYKPVAADVLPSVLNPSPLSVVEQLQDEISRREGAALRPDRIERARPVLKEFESLSLVLGAPSLKVEELSIDSSPAGAVRVRAVVPTTSEAEAALEALRRVGGSTLVDWTQQIAEVPGSTDRRVTYSAKWPARSGAAGAGAQGGAR